jgi:hypothetical protein
VTWIHAAHAPHFTVAVAGNGLVLRHQRDGQPSCQVSQLAAQVTLDDLVVRARDHECVASPSEELRYLIEQSDGDDAWLVEKLLTWHEEKKA